MKHILFIFLFLVGCHQKAEIGEDERIAIALTSETGKQLYQKRQLRAVGWGLSGDDKIEKMSISLINKKPMQLEEARQLLLECIDLYLFNINNSSALRSYLIHYPFIEKDVGVSIITQNEDGTEPSPPYLVCFDIGRDEVCYYINDKSGHYAEFYKETIRAARKAAKEKLPPKEGKTEGLPYPAEDSLRL